MIEKNLSLWRTLYCRVCKDSGYKLEWDRAAHLTAKTLGIHPLQLAEAFPSIIVMQEIATGEHPSCHE